MEKKKQAKFQKTIKNMKLQTFWKTEKQIKKNELIKSKLGDCRLNRWVNLKLIQDATRP